MEVIFNLAHWFVAFILLVCLFLLVWRWCFGVLFVGAI